MANTWWEDTKDWLVWTIRDELYYGLIKPLWGKAVIGMVVAVALAIFAYVQTHPTLFNLAVGATVACVAILGAHLIQTQLPKSQAMMVPLSIPPVFEEIVNQTFERRDVPLDGYKYLGCTFTDVTFVYNNGDAGGFDHTCRVGGKIGFKSEDEHIQTMLGFLGSLRLLRPDLQEKYTAKLGVPNPMSGALVIKTPADLAAYYSRLVSNWADCGRRFKNLELIYDYVQNFWNELEGNKSDAKHLEFERRFPGHSLTLEEVATMQKQMIEDAVELRLSLTEFLSLLGFSFEGTKFAALTSYTKEPVASPRKQGERLQELQLRFKPSPPYVQTVNPGTVYRVGLYNPSERAIVNVQVSLWKMEPTPRDLVSGTDLPYPVSRATNQPMASAIFEPCDINPGDEVLFEFAHTWTTGSPDYRLIVNRVATKGQKPFVQLHRDERWRLHYRVACATHRTIDFVADVSPLNDTVAVHVISSG